MAGALAACSALPIVGGRQGSEFWGFTAPWDSRSAASLARHGAQLDAIVDGWTALDTITGHPVSLYATAAGATTKPAADVRRLMLVTSFAGDRFHTRVVLALAAAPPTVRAAMAGELARAARRGGFGGLVLDFEGHSATDRDALATVVRAIADSARAYGVAPVVVAVPAADTAAYPARTLFAAGADLLLVMLYDEHWPGSAPGPIASPDWARERLARRIAEIGPSRIVVGLPVFGYHWRRDAPADVVSYDDAHRVAESAGVSLEREPASRTLRAVRPDSTEVWVADALLLRALVDDAERAGVRRFSFWRLGLEDPAVWESIVR